MQALSIAVNLLAGLLFGLGLALSGMTHPQKVVDFLDITGHWDPSLLLVLGGAVGVTDMMGFIVGKRLGPGDTLIGVQIPFGGVSPMPFWKKFRIRTIIASAVSVPALMPPNSTEAPIVR